MGNIITIAYTTEGTTDKRFLGNIIERTFESLLYDSNTEIEIHPPYHIIEKGASFNEKIKNVATKYKYFHVICVHCDSDAPSAEKVLSNKIHPTFKIVENTVGACRNLVAIIPVQMTEAWMLADIELFLREINTNKSCNELNLPCKTNQIEKISNPKNRIEHAIREAQSNVPKRRNKLKISELYTPISQKLTLQQLEQLPSFVAFKENARQSLEKLNYLH
ncbi:MAG: DUF4276 family protein [Chlorobi bacterium]|nr:DUF4276 family protein [Chlorobiota bacterium]